ncbi:hypothetical protein ALC56_02322, partial [Trachymyrmex septentrionalis]
LKEPVDKWDTLIIYLISGKLDLVTKKEWELKEKTSTTKQLIEFINTQCELLETLHPAQIKATLAKASTQKTNANKSRNTTLANVTTNEAGECPFCKQTHRLHACKIFKDLTVESRRAETKRLNLCYNCLGSNLLQKCTSRNCKHYSKRHYSLLWIKLNNKIKPEILLSTAVIYIRNDTCNVHKVRALLDNGSQSSISLPQHIKLTDLNFHTLHFTIGICDLLLGATVFWDILEMDRIQLGAKQPVLQSTKLGWLLNEDLQAQIKRFWHIEDMPNVRILSKKESTCEDIFQKKYRRTQDGRFDVPLLFREDPSYLEEYRANALKRLRSLSRMESFHEFLAIRLLQQLSVDHEKTHPMQPAISVTLLSNLVYRVSQALICTISKHYLWTDSEIVLAWIQGESLKRVIATYMRFKQDSHNEILLLNPVLDQARVLRRGRLRNASFSYTQKHPCFRLRPRSSIQLMGDLPASRVTPSRAFRHTSVDYVGPFNIKLSRNKSGKAYLCLFVCMTTKAVHLELTSNQGISWKFLLSHSPHIGGLWTPGHFLIGTSLLTLPETSVLDIPINRTNRHQLLIQMQ